MRIHLFAASILATVVVGCGSSGSGGGPDAGNLISCTDDPRAMTYVPNLSVTSAKGGLKFILVQSDPSPPARGTNTWTMRITDTGGTPEDGLPVSVLPFMPDHGHGTSVNATSTANPDGTYTVNPLYLFMPGVWRVTLSTTGASSDSADFYFCIPG